MSPDHIYHDKKRLASLREQINESLWTGINFENVELMSLKQILQKQPDSEEEDHPEQYIMLSSVLSDTDHEQSIDFEKDYHLIVNRTHIDFNKKNCRLLTFKDVSVHHRLKNQEQKGELLKAMTAYMQVSIINQLNPTLKVLSILKDRIE